MLGTNTTSKTNNFLREEKNVKGIKIFSVLDFQVEFDGKVNLLSSLSLSAWTHSNYTTGQL